MVIRPATYAPVQPPRPAPRVTAGGAAPTVPPVPAPAPTTTVPLGTVQDLQSRLGVILDRVVQRVGEAFRRMVARFRQAPPAAPTPAPPPKPAKGTYTVKAGDTLYQIAAKVLGNGERWREIYALNRDVIGPNPNRLTVGMTLRLEGKPAPAPVPKPRPAPPVPPARDKGTKLPKAPYINQYSPAGASKGYSNGPANCGPASMAMIARAFGYGKGMSDAQLINRLGRMGGTNGNGTNVNGIAAMAQGIGKKAQMRGPGAHVGWIADQIKAGKFVVANGDYFAMDPHENPGRSSGHYVAVVGMKGRNFIVNDPADRRVREVSPEAMAKFIRSNPNGGYQIAVG